MDGYAEAEAVLWTPAAKTANATTTKRSIALVYPSQVFPFRTGKLGGEEATGSSQAGAAKLILAIRVQRTRPSRRAVNRFLLCPLPFLSSKKAGSSEPDEPGPGRLRVVRMVRAVAREKMRDSGD